MLGAGFRAGGRAATLGFRHESATAFPRNLKVAKNPSCRGFRPVRIIFF
mgnify:CR=1 FL=1